MSTAPNSRASLLAGLRTGGVRSATHPSVPQTAAPSGSFNVPRFASFSSQQVHEDETDELADMVSHNLHLDGSRRRHQAVTASAADGVGNRFQHQQQAALFRQLAVQRAAMNGMPLGAMTVDPQLQAQAQLQMQVMQMEMLKLQALQQAQQVQNYQAELMAQAQRQQAQHRNGARPATAGPTNMSFSSLMPQNQSEDYQTNGFDESSVPMTAALGGKFGARSGLNPNANVFTSRVEPGESPKNASLPNGRTTVISGGTSLGGNMTPSKSDSALSWRRGGPAAVNGRSVSGAPAIKASLNGNDNAGTQAFKARPQPLRFNGVINGAVPTVSIENVDLEEGSESDNSFSSDLAQSATINGVDHDGSAESSPSTPPSAGSAGSLSAREEASKRLYEGLGIGRPVHVAPVAPAQLRQVSQPVRHPRGPPASVDELGARNFASRLPLKVTIGEY